MSRIRYVKIMNIPTCVYLSVSIWWGNERTVRGSHGKENDMYDIHSQDLAVPWDLGRLIKLPTAWLNTAHEQRLLTGFPLKSLRWARLQRLVANPAALNPRCWLDSPAATFPTPFLMHADNVYSRKLDKAAAGATSWCLWALRATSILHRYVRIRIKMNILPVLMGCSLSLHPLWEPLFLPPRWLPRVIHVTLIGVMGALAFPLHIWFSLFTQHPRPPGGFPQQVLAAALLRLKLPSRGSRSQPWILIETGNLPVCLSDTVFPEPVPASPLLFRGPRCNCLLRFLVSLRVSFAPHIPFL